MPSSNGDSDLYKNLKLASDSVLIDTLEQLVEDAARTKGVQIPEEMPEPDPNEKPISKSSRVREFLEEFPESRNKDIADALAEYGVRAADVANVKAQLKKKADKKARNKATHAAANAAPAAAIKLAAVPDIDATIELSLLETGVEFVRKAGGINEALHVLGVIRRIRSL